MATSAPKSIPKVVPKIVPPDESNEEFAPKSKSKMKLVVITCLLLALLGGGAAWYFLVYAKPQKAAGAAKKVAAPPVFMVLESFTVNLLTEGGDQFLQTALTLQVADQAQVELFKLYMPEVRNRLLLLLSGKQAAEILTVDGKKKLAEEIIVALKKPFVENGQPQAVSNVYFTSFVIQ